MNWTYSGRCANSRARAGGAGIHPLLPGIVRYASERAIANAAPAKLRNGRLADGDCTGRAQTLNVRAVEVRNAIAEDMRAGHGAHATGKGQILDAGRHAVQDAQRPASHD